MHYCGVVPIQGWLQLAMLEEVRTPEPPIRLSAIFFEPGSAEQVAAELQALGESWWRSARRSAVRGEGRGAQRRRAPPQRGVCPQPADPASRELAGDAERPAAVFRATRCG